MQDKTTDGMPEGGYDVPPRREDSDVNHQHQETVHSGGSIKGQIKRGTDTRNQDTITIKGKGATAEEAAENFEQELQALEEQGWADRLRQIQPEEDQDDG